LRAKRLNEKPIRWSDGRQEFVGRAQASLSEFEFNMIVPNLKNFVGFLLAAWVAVISAVAQSTNNSPPPAPRRASIIFILADDLGYGDLGSYGQTRIKTPNLDRLAAEGIRFTSCYAGSTVCSPARAALMLGQHTGHLKIRGNARPTSLASDDVTVARMLKESGYRTALIG